MSTDAEWAREIGRFLAEHSRLTLATVDAGGRPMAASLFFAADEALNLFWTSGASNRHSRNLAHNPMAAATVHRETWTWSEIAGVQVEGEATPVPAGLGWQACWELYLAKFPFVVDFQAEISRSNFYRLAPRWVRLIDNSRSFGFKQELYLGAGEAAK